MKFTFPWTKHRSASLEDLRGQLSQAHIVLDLSERAVVAAQGAFDETGSADAEKALVDARDAARSAEEHVGRAERLVAAAEEKRAEAERLERAAQIRKLESKLEDTRRVTELAEAEFKAWCGVVDARLARMDHEEERGKVRRELLMLGARNDAPTEQVRIYEVAVLLGESAERVRKTDPRRYEVLGDFARNLVPDLHRVQRHVYIAPPPPPAVELPLRLPTREELSGIAQTAFGNDDARASVRRGCLAALAKQEAELAIAPGFTLVVERNGKLVRLKEGDEITLADLERLPLEFAPHRFMDLLVNCWRVLKKGDVVR